MVARRRPRTGVGEPLFGADWWQQDQQLFQDSLARRSPTRPSRRRAPRRTTQPGSLPGGYAQGALFSEDDLLPHQGAENEPIRPDGSAALGAVAADPVHDD